MISRDEFFSFAKQTLPEEEYKNLVWLFEEADPALGRGADVIRDCVYRVVEDEPLLIGDTLIRWMSAVSSVMEVVSYRLAKRQEELDRKENEGI